MSRTTPPPIALSLGVLLLCLAFASCGVTDFVGAYFNTYYNSQKLFSEAEEEIWSQQDTKLSGHNLLIPLNIPAGARQKLTSVIEKCSKLLQYHPDSKLVDDAVLMVGKAFFYQADFARAERKFKELIDSYPTSSLVLEARVLLAYTQYKSNDLETALASGRAVLEAIQAEGDDDLEGYTLLLLGQIEQDRKNFSQARGFFEQAGQKAGNSDLRATALLTAADMYNQTGDSLHALEAYVLAEKEASNYVSEFRAKVGQAKMMGKLARQEEALDLLQGLRRNTNYREYWGDVDLEIGNLYQYLEAFDSAIGQYAYIDTAYARSEAAANADYQLGLIYENHFGRYDSARAAYARGRSASPQWVVAPLIVQRSDLLNRHDAGMKAVRLNDSLLAAYLAGKDSAAAPAVPPRVDSAAAHAADTLRGAGQAAGQQAEAAPGGSPPQAAAVPVVPLDSVHARLASAMNEVATLWYTGFGKIDSAEAWYRRLLKEYPASPHTPRALYTMARMYASRDSTASRGTVDSLYRVIVEQYPRSEFAAEARRLLGLPPVQAVVDPAETAYHQAERLLLDGKFTEAVGSFRRLYDAYPGSPYASRAAYAAGWIYEQKLNVPDSALALYRRVAQQYPASSYAALVRPKLEAVEQKNAPPPGTPAPGTPPAGQQLPGPTSQIAPPAGGGGQDTSAVPVVPRLRQQQRRLMMEDSLRVPAGRRPNADSTAADSTAKEL